METIESISVPMYQTASIAERDMRILLAGNYQDMHHHFLAPRTICEWVILLCGRKRLGSTGQKRKNPSKSRGNYSTTPRSSPLLWQRRKWMESIIASLYRRNIACSL